MAEGRNAEVMLLQNLIGKLVEACEIGLGSHRAAGEQHGFPVDLPLRLIAAEEAESAIRSFVASDRRVLAEELLPSYGALATYLDRYSKHDIEGTVGEIDESEITSSDRWKYVPSDLLRWFVESDAQRTTKFSIVYAEILLDLADAVCLLDGHIDRNEIRDFNTFAEMLDEELRHAGICHAGDFDLVTRRWKRHGDSPQIAEPAASGDVEGLLKVLFAPEATSAAANRKLHMTPARCVSSGCQRTASNSPYCERCSDTSPAVLMGERYIEVEDFLDDRSSVAGPCDCGAAYLTNRRSASRVWLECHQCGQTFRIRPVPRHLLGSSSH